MKYYWYIKSGPDESLLFNHDIIQKRQCILLVDDYFPFRQHHSHKLNVAHIKQLYLYFQEKCSDELHFWLPAV